MIKTEIKPMAHEHIEKLAEIGRECFSIPWSEEGFLAELRKEGEICLTALAEGEPVGFLCASFILDEGELSLMAVKESCQGQGIAGKLLEGLFLRAKEASLKMIHLEVRASNLKAIHLYEKYGFLSDGMRKGYYRRPLEDALLYTKHFSD